MKRPDGSGQLKASFWLLAVGIVSAMLAFSTNVIDYNGNIDPDKIAIRAALGLISGGLLSFAAFLAAVGWIIRAIYFLPGREIESETEAYEEPRQALDPKITAILIVVAIATAGLIAQTVLIPR